jgi:predicted transcriptional regulator
VADLLGISSNTVSRRLQRFVVNSRKYLKRTEEQVEEQVDDQVEEQVEEQMEDQPELLRKSG